MMVTAGSKIVISVVVRTSERDVFLFISNNNTRYLVEETLPSKTEQTEIVIL